MESIYHIPVLLRESVDGLDIQPDGVYVDVTFGGGGHSKEILSRLGAKGHLYSFDQDADAEKNIVNDDRFTFSTMVWSILTDCWLIWACRVTISMTKHADSLSALMPLWICV